jgi:hypothetical protein
MSNNSEFKRLKLENEQMKNYIGQLQEELDTNGLNRLNVAISFFKGLDPSAPRYEEMRDIITSGLIGPVAVEEPTPTSEFVEGLTKA